jgi:hypothetical protein
MMPPGVSSVSASTKLLHQHEAAVAGDGRDRDPVGEAQRVGGVLGAAGLPLDDDLAPLDREETEPTRGLARRRPVSPPHPSLLSLPEETRQPRDVINDSPRSFK